MAGVRHAQLAGVSRGAPGGVDDRDLAPRGARVGRDELRERLAGRQAGGEQVEAARAVGDLDVRLGGHGADACARPRHERADREPVRLHGDAELAGGGIPRDDRVGALAGARAAYTTAGRRSAHGCASSSCAASDSSVASSVGRPKSCTATGSPSSARPTGSEIAGWPEALAIAV